MTINTRNKIQTPLSSSLLKSVLTDLYTESKERERLTMTIWKMYNFRNFEDLSDLLKSAKMSVKSEDFNGYSEHSEDLCWYTDILDILRISNYTSIQVYRYTVLDTDDQI